jgi:pSer/pThr/pTyr-binding forkhead associated (FHA) protein
MLKERIRRIFGKGGSAIGTDSQGGTGKTCPKCGQAYTDGKSYCVACGARLAPSPPSGPFPQTAPQGFDEETTLLNLPPAADDDATTLLAPPGPSAILVVEKTGEEIDVDKPVFRIGRKRSEVDYFVEGSRVVSRKHAEIMREGDRWFIKDLGSKNRTCVDDAPLEPFHAGELRNGAHIRIADVEFVFYIKGGTDGNAFGFV